MKQLDHSNYLTPRGATRELQVSSVQTGDYEIGKNGWYQSNSNKHRPSDPSPALHDGQLTTVCTVRTQRLIDAVYLGRASQLHRCNVFYRVTAHDRVTAHACVRNSWASNDIQSHYTKPCKY